MKENQNRQKEAVALTYKAEAHAAPIVIAKGRGLVAEQILSKASELDIPIQKDPNLVAMLGQLNLNEAIPEELYEAVAEVFAFIYRVDQSMKHSQKNISE
ncbi:EscU/YscU/HrcU family type III secretion system export apparatus switch protein [Heyndrickxia ginsengihumi]|uniref:Type III secretion exporter n=1 Tax=Heyndrickxia ginsengihumi TaxID=363870 RepID=A0A0A6VEZ7_9BACI|nr:EscU/YscU/HrcU family type III secretion system export apparatus switch protein [Heyndrickxia ginsengihumi]KHD86156.1 type III secretion exporter [Heyndrickxia ginsengihumi]MBE6183876.1 type III secretion system protein [Bacillus sp. (in: firmicutes)]MCM3022478.1 EscU/YscU/HrcU family type III secretion system export apparatus switch protein [Heyndrickxia ginsengihumi]NEY19598.1 type III secretion system protein [Heyndrickxia ginsengihumi]